MQQIKQKHRSIRSKTRIRAVCCVGISLVLYGALSFLPPPESPLSSEGTIRREGYGGDISQYQVYVDGVMDEPVPLMIEVGAKRYTEEEAKHAFQKIRDSMEERIRGGNPSLEEVRTALLLPTWVEEYGIRLRWGSSDPELLDPFGKVQAAKTADMPEGRWVTLQVQMSADEFRKEYEIPVRVLPVKQTPQQAFADGLLREIRSRDVAQQTMDVLILPEEYEGKKLRYQSGGENSYGILLALGFFMAVLCYAKEQADIKEQGKRRERELLLDYPELLSKLLIFTGAGMTLRGAWERMVKDYENAVSAGKQKRRAAYEEMAQTWRQLQNGTAEGTAYREFGKRCRLQPYMKLSSLLEQNRKTGTKNLRGIFQMEMADAFEQRKNLARRLGEEAGTKLLLPLFMMLGIVMVMIMVPAMMTMG